MDHVVHVLEVTLRQLCTVCTCPGHKTLHSLLYSVTAGQAGLVDHGVHAFVVPLRDEAGRCLPGVEIHDCGYKVRRQQVAQGLQA